MWQSASSSLRDVREGAHSRRKLWALLSASLGADTPSLLHRVAGCIDPPLAQHGEGLLKGVNPRRRVPRAVSTVCHVPCLLLDSICPLTLQASLCNILRRRDFVLYVDLLIFYCLPSNALDNCLWKSFEATVIAFPPREDGCLPPTGVWEHWRLRVPSAPFRGLRPGQAFVRSLDELVYM